MPESDLTLSDTQKLAALEKRLAVLRQRRSESSPQSNRPNHYSQAQIGWRMVLELVIAVIMGFGIGYGFDALFGSRPLFMIIFIACGLAAGIRVMMRTAKEIEDKNK